MVVSIQHRRPCEPHAARYFWACPQRVVCWGTQLHQA